jgi:hypothetical protein
MNKSLFDGRNIVAAFAVAVSITGGANFAYADERADLEQLRATTLSLIEALVETGAISREKADRLLREAENKAQARLAQSQPLVTGSQPAAEIGKDGKKVVRVPFVPESVKREIRDQVKQEVMAQAKEERWAAPATLPEWLDRFQFEGDLRLRYDNYRLDPSNTAPGAGYNNGGLTRGADFINANGNLTGVPGTNTQEDFSRTRLRARFGFNAKVSEMVTAGLRISSGSTSGPTSTNQTLGQGFNKYSLVLDRAFVTVKPASALTLTGGRIANPFMSTDLVWADDLGFEGFVASYKPQVTPNFGAFLTGGWFPLRTDNPLQTSARNLTGGQAGFDWKLSPVTDFKLSAAMYQFHGIEGTLESNARYGLPSASDYGTRFEYPNGLRQRGNTLFVVNALADPLTGTTYWGLASEFREFNMTGVLDLAAFGPNHIMLTGDFVKNLAFDRANMARRTGSAIIDGKDYGYMGKLLVGRPALGNRGDWNVSLAYRWLGSDAVVDAYTNSDFGLGGTNNKGYVLGGSYALDKNSWVSVRWMASDLIDSAAPKTTAAAPAATKLSTDLLQVDFNVKF